MSGDGEFKTGKTVAEEKFFSSVLTGQYIATALTVSMVISGSEIPPAVLRIFWGIT